jgi:hypothetical protein
MSGRRRVCLVLTKFGQPAHNASPAGAQSGHPTSHQKAVRGTVVTRIAHAQVVITGGGITNAPSAISMLRV